MESAMNKTPTSSTARRSQTKLETLRATLRRWADIPETRKDLLTLFMSADPGAPLEDRVVWLTHLVDWLRKPFELDPESDPAHPSLLRLRFLLDVLESDSKSRQTLARIVRSVLAETDASTFYSQIALRESGSGLFSEILHRVVDRFAPPKPRPHELGYVIDVVFSHPDDAEWVLEMSHQDWERLIAVLEWPSDWMRTVRERLKQALADTVSQLSVRVAALGLDPEVRARAHSTNPVNGAKSLVELNRAATLWRAGVSVSSRADSATGQVHPHALLTPCRQVVRRIYASIEHEGVSLALLYRLETLTALLDRLEILLTVLDTSIPAERRTLEARALLARVIRSQRDSRSVARLFSLNFDVFARKIVQHAGEKGEHYITRTASEYWAMFRSGGLGGLITLPMTLLKIGITHMNLPLFFEGLFIGVNYSGAFIAMQFVGATLATKQPSVTAAALARKIRVSLRKDSISELTEEIVRITRSQFIAVMGNVGLAIPASVVFCAIYNWTTGGTVLDEAYAFKTLKSFDPFTSLSLLYAAMTGVVLWWSSLAAGWVQNWFNYRGFPRSLARHKGLCDLVGENKAQGIANWITRHGSGIGGNLAIGFSLAFVPIAGQFTGLPLDIRHVTLSSASLAAAVMSINPTHLPVSEVVRSGFGVFLIGMLNFGVSTVLALFVATRAQKVRRVLMRALLVQTAKQFRKRPLRFFLPPRRTAQNEEA
jgi:site-specific recombinase